MTTTQADPPVHDTDAPPPGALTDGDIVALPPARTLVAVWRGLVDRLAGSDPGMQQLRTALRSVLGMGLAVLGAWALVSTTGELEADPTGLPAAVVAAQDHAALVVAILLAALTAMFGGFGVNDPSPRGQLVTTLLLPVPIWLAMAVGVLLDQWRVVLYVWLVLALMTGVWLRRFGPRGFASGIALFQGAFLGYFLGAQLGVGGLGWVAADLYLGAVASLVVRFGLLHRDAASILRAMWTSWRSRARRLLLLAAELTDAGCTDRRRASLHEQLRRQLLRLNESTLMIDAQLADPDASSEALLLHQRLFDMELSLTNVCRFAVAITDHCPEPAVREAIERCLHALQAVDYGTAERALADLRAVRPEDLQGGVLVDRFGQSVESLDRARTGWLAVAAVQFGRRGPAGAAAGDARTAAGEPGDAAPFTPAVGLQNGYLPGSGPVSDEAATRRGPNRFLDSARLSGPVRAALQVGVAATIAIVAGGLLSDRRLYWALLATFLAFLATSNSGEQVRKAFFRVAGTAIGIVAGAVIVHVIDGNLPGSLAIIAVAMFLGIYLIRTNYMFMVIGITITMSLLYVQLGEFTWSLLVLRLEETAIGVGAVVVTVLLVVPLRPQRVLAAGVLLWFRALRRVIDASLGTLDGTAHVDSLDVRGLDAAYQSLVTTARPLHSTTFGRNGSQLREILAVAAAARNYARNLAVEVRPRPGGDSYQAWDTAVARFRDSLAVVERRLDCGETAPYVRSAALFDLVDREIPDSERQRLAFRDLVLLDGTMARLATALRLPVEDLDTAPAPA